MRDISRDRCFLVASCTCDPEERWRCPQQRSGPDNGPACTCDPEDTGPTGHMEGCPRFRVTEQNLDAILDRIERMTDEEILADAKARGVDLDAQAERVRKLLLNACRRAREAKDRIMADPMPYREEPAPGSRVLCFELEHDRDEMPSLQERWERERGEGCRCPFGLLLQDCPIHGEFL